MFGLGVWELVIISIVAVLLFGSKLPQVASNIGRAIPSFKKGLREVEQECRNLEEDIRGAGK